MFPEPLQPFGVGYTTLAKFPNETAFAKLCIPGEWIRSRLHSFSVIFHLGIARVKMLVCVKINREQLTDKENRYKL